MKPAARRGSLPGLLILLLAAAPAGALAQPPPAVITGEVREAGTGRPLPAANLILEGTLLGGISDRTGRFRIPGVKPGDYRLRVSVMGYRSEVRELQLAPGATVEVVFELHTAPIELPDVVITAGRQEQRAEEAAAAVSVLSARQIALRAARQLDTVLPLLPGVTMMDDQVGIRGSTGYARGVGGRVLVLQDGVPVVGGDTGNVRWDALPAEAIERVEVIKGASSSLYGSAAMGGVLNVITRSAQTGPSTSLRLRAGTWEQPWFDEYVWDRERRYSRGGEFTFIRPVGGLGLLVSAGLMRSDGFRQNGWNRNTFLFTKLEGPREGRDRWEGALTVALHDHGNFFEWASPKDPYEVASDARGDWIRSDKLTFTSSWRRLHGSDSFVQVQPWLTGVRWRNHLHDNQEGAEVLQGGVDVQRVAAWRGGTLTLGGMAALIDVQAEMYGARSVREGAVFLQHERRLAGMLRLSAGTRLDYHQAAGLARHLVVSPRLALIADPAPDLVLRLAAGRGFRAPSVAETFVNTATSGFRVVPNTRLEPETAWTLESGAVWNPLPFLGAEVSLFTGRWSSMIEPVPRPEDGDIQFQNLRRARLQGAELALRGAVPGGWLRGEWAHTWLSARDLDDGRPLAYRRPRQGTVTVELGGGLWTLGADWRYGATVDRVQLYPYDRRVPQRRLDGRLALSAAGLRLVIQGNNLTRYAYTDIERNLSAPREWLVTLERSW
jgi:outer membrane receptor for ferrienterochelin and colicins